MSKEQKEYLKKIKLNKILITITQILIVLLFIILWQILSDKKIINPFIFSSPKKMLETTISLYKNYNLIAHILTTLYETIVAFLLGISLGFIIAIILYECKTLAKIVDPFLTMINSLPKVALGPIIIIWAGANKGAIIVMALLINLIISIMTIYNGFLNTDNYKIKLLQSFKATKLQILTNVVIPESYSTIISSLKINISMSLIGVIMGEFLVSKQGIGYLIIYGTQIFNLNIVMSGIIILIIISFILYEIIDYIEKKLLKEK
jgi:NitT/TauT family transport system permease protein